MLIVSENLLTFLPYTMSLLRLIRLDISSNPFVNFKDFKLDAVESCRIMGREDSFTTLFERAAGVVMTFNLKKSVQF